MFRLCSLYKSVRKYMDQAEEERQERERKERQKEMGLAQACVRGSATANLSWANRTAAVAAAAAATPTVG